MSGQVEQTEAAADIAPVLAFLGRAGLLADGATPRIVALSGGVSSDIWRVDLPDRAICVKRALPRLKVAAVWEAPIERNAYEWGWMRRAAACRPAAVPKLIVRDDALGMFAMEYLDPADHPVWKAQLLAGVADPAMAAQVGETLAAIHGATAGDPAVAAEFATDAIFHAIRLEPYLLATARAHPDLAAVLAGLAERTAGTRRGLVHGDVSPKNILIGPDGPVFLDAECAWYGDPAFDLAFCLNHLLLKCLARPAAMGRFLGCYDALADAYRRGITWEDRADLESRAAALLPALFLARIDGKSPAEYITAADDKEDVRTTARALLRRPPSSLDVPRAHWAAALAARAASTGR